MLVAMSALKEHTQTAYSDCELFFFETPVFTNRLPDYLADDEYRELQRTLMSAPTLGGVIPGTGGFRKLRWSDPRRHKGRRGGLRIIYYLLAADCQFWMFTIYDKNEIEDLTAKQCRLLGNAIREELRARRANE